ncbi:MAG TPA: VOC family protein, partial [Ktedonobacteraceae bacterium]|nr:VOC family protein [Ktedonobacteraceae bacterium]
VVHELPGILCFLSFAGSQILLSAPGGAMQDETDFLPSYKRIFSELSIRVPDCSAAYEILRSRGAEFITPPAHCRDERRAFFHDPDGHLLEIWEAREA